jgi:hypothetical protein
VRLDLAYWHGVPEQVETDNDHEMNDDEEDVFFWVIRNDNDMGGLWSDFYIPSLVSSMYIHRDPRASTTRKYVDSSIAPLMQAPAPS